MKLSLKKRINALEKRQPYAQGYSERILAAMTDEELDRLEPIVEQLEQGIEPTVEEWNFLDDLEARYAPY